MEDMPRGDGTGPMGAGPETGRGRGARPGRWGSGGMGMGMGMGGDGDCFCPSCGNVVPYQVGTPCYNIKCPKCGTMMVRQ